MVEIRTKSLFLRPYLPEDAPALYNAKWASLLELRAWMDWAQKDPTLESEKETIAHFQKKMKEDEPRRELALAIFLHDGTFIGSGGWMYKQQEVPSFELGYWLDSRHTGEGYMHEAVMAQTDYLFQQQKANRVMVRCHHDNEHSARVANRAGFRLEGCHRNARRHVDGKLAHDLVFAHTPETWQELK